MQKLKHEFWIEFSETYPRKWLLYDTKIKDFSFKFFADNKIAKVMIDIESRDQEKRLAYFEKLESLKGILDAEFIEDLIFERSLVLETGKSISRVWVERSGLSMGNRAHWPNIFIFFNEKMDAFERFYNEYDEYIKDV